MPAEQHRGRAAVVEYVGDGLRGLAVGDRYGHRAREQGPAIGDGVVEPVPGAEDERHPVPGVYTLGQKRASHPLGALPPVGEAQLGSRVGAQGDPVGLRADAVPQKVAERDPGDDSRTHSCDAPSCTTRISQAFVLRGSVPTRARRQSGADRATSPSAADTTRRSTPSAKSRMPLTGR